MSKTYYYFSTNEKKLRYGDNRPIKEGETHSVEGELVLCENGLHASERVIDALKYAPGSTLWLVELSGEIVEGEDKVCARSRKYIKEIDCEELLREFARKQALINIEKIKPYCSAEAFSLIVDYLETGNDELRSAAWSAARSAAWSAESAESAESAAWSAARSAESAAESAARSVAWSAAWSAARSAESAAESAARSVAWSTAWSAAWSAESAAWSAAWSAESVAWSTAWSAESAAESAADDMLMEMIKNEMEK